MDIEKGGSSNIEDIIKLLKDTVENTPNAENIDTEEVGGQSADNMDTELLKATLRNKFISDDENTPEETEKSDEYAIDESFVSDAEDIAEERCEEMPEEPEKEPQEEIEEDEEVLEAEPEEELSNVGEDYYTDSEESAVLGADGIVEIAIPWVDSIPEEDVLEEEDEFIEDEEDELTYDEEDESENGFVMFAEGEFSDDTDDFDGMEEDDEELDENTDEDLIEEVADESVTEEIEEDLLAEAEEATENEEISDDTDDVPWFDTPDRTFVEEETTVFLSGEPTEEADVALEGSSVMEFSEEEITEQITEETAEEAVENTIEETVEETPEEIFEELSEEITEEPAESEVLEEDLAEENGDGEEDTDLLAFDESEYEEDTESLKDLEAVDGIELSENESEEVEDDPVKTVDFNSGESDDDGESFYRTMVEANAQLEKEYANNRYVNISDIEESDTEYDAFGISDEDGIYGSEESINSDGEENDAAATDIVDSVIADDVPSDFYSLRENDAHPEEDEEHEECITETQVEFEEDGEAERAFVSFIKSRFWKIIRPILLTALGILVFIIEIIPILNIVPDGILDYTTYPWLYILFDIQLTVFMAALCFSDFKEGLTNLFSRTPRLWSVLSATVTATLLHSVVALFCIQDSLPSLYNSIGAIYLVAATVFDILNEKRIEHSMETLSADEEKIFALKRSSGPNSCAEKMYRGGIDPDTDIFEPVQVGKKNCEGVFARESKYFDNTFLVSAIVPIAVFAVFISVISIVLELGLVTTVNTVIYVFLLLTPLSAIVAHHMPLYFTYLRLRDRGCFISGYASAKDIAECDAVVFSDRHLFCECDPHNAGIKLYCEEHKTKELFSCLAAVFASVGGPMENTFGEVIKDEKHKVNMIRITRNGFEAVVDGKTNIIVGSTEYLSRYGIRTDGADTRESGIIYAAMNSVLCAKLSLSYETQPLFEELCELLGDNSIRTVIQTYDPIITGKYVVKRRKKDKYPISVVHKNVNDYNTPMSEKVVGGKTGAFALSSRLRLVELAVFAKSLAKLVKINSIIRVILYALGGIIGIATVLLGFSSGINMLWVLIYQIFAVSALIYATIICLPVSFEQIIEKRRKAQLKQKEKQEKEIYDQDEQD